MREQEDILEIRNVFKSYGDHMALKNFSLSIPRGAIFGLIGPNGAGKTSLIRIITQILRPDKGHIVFNGEELKLAHINKIGYLPEERGVYKRMKVIDYLNFIAELRELPSSLGNSLINDWLVKFELNDWAKKEIGSLSKGMQQKVQFIATILHDPELIILDEPFSGFDPINQELLSQEIQALREAGKTIIFSTHRMESIEEICTHVALVNKSSCILKGTIEEIQKKYTKEESQLTLCVHGESIQKKMLTEEVRDYVSNLSDETIVESIVKEEKSIKDIFIELVNEEN